MSGVGPMCPHCGHIHVSRDAIAVGRFDPNGPSGYRARHEGAPVRQTRDEASDDACRNRLRSLPNPIRIDDRQCCGRGLT